MKGIGFFFTFLAIILIYGVGVYVYVKKQTPPPPHHQVRPKESFAEPSECTTPFGTLLGVVNGTPAFSNCRRGLRMQWVGYFDFNDPMDVSEPRDATHGKKFMTAARYTAMDFVMRWFAHNRGLMLTGGKDVESLVQNAAYFYNPAHGTQEWDAEFIQNHRVGRTPEELTYLRPRVGDIVVYDHDYKQDFPEGHMAVIVGVENDIEGAGGPRNFKERLNRMVPPRILYLAEQNFANTPWEGRNYSRIAHFRWTESSHGGAPEGYVDDPVGPRVLGRLRVGKPRLSRGGKSLYESGDDL
ncbi:unnamed protein product [Phytomonas sp. EM1]|nr:unnamed protein product [Phytomonas sp. EM1]|eukprot:CCW64350.1 unnamed protein product [Phytomonas sp. isolate EM1]